MKDCGQRHMDYGRINVDIMYYNIIKENIFHIFNVNPILKQAQQTLFEMELKKKRLIKW